MMDSCEMSTLGLRPRFDISTSEHICHTRHHASFVLSYLVVCICTSTERDDLEQFVDDVELVQRQPDCRRPGRTH